MGAGHAPDDEKLKVAPPGRGMNKEYRPREWLTENEVEQVIKSAGQVGRHRFRDQTMILVAYTHALRVSELVNLRRSQIDFSQGVLHVRRVKGGRDSVHPLRGREIRALRRLFREYPDGPHVFVTERGGPLTVNTFQRIVARAGSKAGIDFPVHAHMLRHALGYRLANTGYDTRVIQQYMGHSDIRHTVRYTELRADRFNGFWQD